MGETPGWGAPQQPHVQYGDQWAWNSLPYRPPEFKPGIVPLRPLAVGEILDGAFATIRLHARVVFGFAAVLAAVLTLTRTLVGVAFGDVSTALSGLPYHTSGPSDDLQIHVAAVGIVSDAVEYVGGVLFGVLLTGMVTGVVGQAVLGRPVDGRVLVRDVARRFWGLLATSLVATLAPLLSFALVLIGVVGVVTSNVPLAVFGFVVGVGGGGVLAVFCWTRLGLAAPVYVLERARPGRALRRSWQLVRGSFWRILGLWLLGYLLVEVAGGVLNVLFTVASGAVGGFHDLGGVGGTRPIGAVAISALGATIVWIVTQPFMASVVTLIYIDRRMRAEALDLALTQAARSSVATPTR